MKGVWVWNAFLWLVQALHVVGLKRISEKLQTERRWRSKRLPLIGPSWARCRLTGGQNERRWCSKRLPPIGWSSGYQRNKCCLLSPFFFFYPRETHPFFTIFHLLTSPIFFFFLLPSSSHSSSFILFYFHFPTLHLILFHFPTHLQIIFLPLPFTFIISFISFLLGKTSHLGNIFLVIFCLFSIFFNYYNNIYLFIYLIIEIATYIFFINYML